MPELTTPVPAPPAGAAATGRPNTAGTPPPITSADAALKTLQGWLRETKESDFTRLVGFASPAEWRYWREAIERLSGLEPPSGARSVDLRLNSAGVSLSAPVRPCAARQSARVEFDARQLYALRTEFAAPDGRSCPSGRTSFEFSLSAGQTGEGAESLWRVQASSAFGGRAWSLTMRGNVDGGSWAASSRYGFTEANLVTGGLNEQLKKTYLYSFEEMVASLEAPLKLKEDPDKAKGILLITGRTGSGKSEIARGLVEVLLRAQTNGGKRRPHLVTFEDPIETPFYTIEARKSGAAGHWDAVDYTPRELGKDCAALEEATRAALRQTTAAFYAGEIRDKEQMRAALEFAATGHLIVATAHSGSLVEAVSKILDAVGAKTPAARAEWAPRIFAVAHLERFKSKGDYGAEKVSCGAVVPALYLRTPRGLGALIADGKFALTPGRSEGGYSFGHAYFASRLSATPPLESTVAEASGAVWLPIWRALRLGVGDSPAKVTQSVFRAAVERDLRD